MSARDNRAQDGQAKQANVTAFRAQRRGSHNARRAGSSHVGTGWTPE
jgi:hypothetical protein